MDIKVLKTLLTTLDLVGIVQAVFEPIDGGKTQIRGANKDKNIIIFDSIEEDLVTLPMGIQSVPGLLSRISLFDEEKASIKIEDNGRIVTEMTIKQGRRKVSFRFQDPTIRKGGLGVPGVIEENIDDIQEIVFTEDYVKYISTVISSMAYTGNRQERQVSLESEDEETLVLKISDGEDDSFVDPIAVEGVELDSRAAWEVTPFEKMLKQSMEVNPGKKAKFGISLHHIAVFDLGVIRALVVPLH